MSSLEAVLYSYRSNVAVLIADHKPLFTVRQLWLAPCLSVRPSVCLSATLW